MRIALRHLLILIVVSLSACSTTQQVTLTKVSLTNAIRSVAQKPQEGNSPEMTAHVVNALLAEGISIKAPLPAATRTATDVDAIVSYGDSWSWDMAMYLASLSIQMYDAKTGELLITGEWTDSTLHGFRDAKSVVQGLVAEMMSKVRSETKPH